MRYPCTTCCLPSGAIHHRLSLNLQAAIFSFQNSDKYWEDAQMFRPERFLAKPDNSERASSLPAFCAFGDVSSCAYAIYICSMM